MRFLVAPQEFKGSLTAREAAALIAAGLANALPAAEVEQIPLSDGGPGLVDALLSANGGDRVEAECHDPLMRPIRASFGVTRDGTAVIEMAAASGLVLLRAEERDPLLATTYGTGELIRAALDRRCTRLTVGVGGSATVDGGAGALQALGARLLDASGSDLRLGGGALRQLEHIDLSGIDGRLAGVTILVACDVRNPLVGDDGAAAVFGPQKGASPDGIRVLEEGTRRFGAIARRDCGIEVANVPGGGAAGGLGAGLMLAGATIEPGFELVAAACGLVERIAGAAAVITGEGRLDEQTPYGKTAWGVARIARGAGVPVGIIAGHIDPTFTHTNAFDEIEQLRPPGTSLEETMSRAGELLPGAAAKIALRLLSHGGRGGG